MAHYNSKFLDAKSGLADWLSDPVPVAADGWRRASFTLLWSAIASTAGVLSFEGTDDPAGTSWVVLTVSTFHGTYPNVAAAAAVALIVLDNCPGWIRVRYTRSGGGAAAQFNGWVTRSQ